ncbi:MAG: response regulator transcription factor [Pelagimonas sp.]|jgi:DNA-binding NarL/FixJ family response regulator|nr:response regulator transcription factor [Pelagimonas sp.]
MRILLADDHEMVRDTFAAYLETEGRAVVVTVPNYFEVKKVLASQDPFDLVLLDYSMPGMNGIDGLADTLREYPQQGFAIISGTAPSRLAHEVVECGARGYVPKSMSAKSLVNAVKFMVAGETYVPAAALEASDDPSETDFTRQFSKRERDVLSGLCLGRSNKEIALTLDLQEVTIKLHVRNICKKLNAKNRTQVALIARDAGFE